MISTVYRIPDGEDSVPSYDNSIRLRNGEIQSWIISVENYVSSISKILPIEYPKHCQVLNVDTERASSYQLMEEDGGNFMIHTSSDISVGILSANSDNKYGFFSNIHKIDGLTDIKNVIVDSDKWMFILHGSDLSCKNIKTGTPIKYISSDILDMYYVTNVFNFNRIKWSNAAYQSYTTPVEDVVVKTYTPD